MNKHIMLISVPLMGYTNQLIALEEELAHRGYRVSIVLHEAIKAWGTDRDIQFIPWKFKRAGSNEVYLAQKDTFWRKIAQEPHPWCGNQLMIGCASQTAAWRSGV